MKHCVFLKVKTKWEGIFREVLPSPLLPYSNCPLHYHLFPVIYGFYLQFLLYIFHVSSSSNKQTCTFFLFSLFSYTNDSIFICINTNFHLIIYAGLFSFFLLFKNLIIYSGSCYISVLKIFFIFLQAHYASLCLNIIVHLTNFLCIIIEFKSYSLQFQTILNKLVHLYVYIIRGVSSGKSYKWDY